MTNGEHRNTPCLTVPLQEASIDIWRSKYRLTNGKGFIVDETIDDTYKRVAQALSDVEEENKNHWYNEFLWALRNGAIPAGRIIANAGASGCKSSTSTINCTVSSTIKDTMQDILMANYEAGLTLKAGCGIGYEFSTLRPAGAFVSGAGAKTSGPLSFMDIFDRTCFTVSSAGGRRGAQMGTLDISHPDVVEFITAKRENGRLRQFNLSLLITKDFIEAVKHDLNWQLVFPIRDNHEEELHGREVVWKEWPTTEGYYCDELGRVACKKYSVIKARALWEIIMSSTYDYAEPGFILIDKVNDMNNNWFCEKIRATNPCGEQPLPENGSCLLGSINLTTCVVNPFSDSVYFDWEKYKKLIRIFTRALDNVVEINGLPLESQRAEIERKRRHGMGFLGLGSTLTMMHLCYGSEKSCTFTENLALTLAAEGWAVGVELAKEKGPAPIMNEKFKITPELCKYDPRLENDFGQGTEVSGRILHTRSKYMQQLRQSGYPGIENVLTEMELFGSRFTHHTSIAPTGTISLSLANNASNGIEPSFAHHYSRNIIKEGKKSKEKVDVYSYEMLAYKHFVNENAEPNDPCLPKSFVSSEYVYPEQHIAIQAAAQKWIDSSISKTINIPTDYPYEDFKDVYMKAYDAGLKGCTTFRFNPEAFQGVLVKESDIESTTYIFTLEDNEQIELKGNEQVEYDGEIHTAANLYDALKEGYYGKF